MYWTAPMLGAYIFIFVLSFGGVDLFIIMECPSLSLVTVFILKSILYDMSIDTPALFWFVCIEYLFPAPHFKSVCVPRSEVGLF